MFEVDSPEKAPAGTAMSLSKRAARIPVAVDAVPVPQASSSVYGINQLPASQLHGFSEIKTGPGGVENPSWAKSALSRLSRKKG